MTRQAVVFGATGFIGRNLTAALTARGVEVHAVSRSGAGVPGAASNTAMDRLSDLPALAADAVVMNVAAVRYQPKTFAAEQGAIAATNVALANQVYDFCVARGLKEVRQASSSAVYPAGLPIMDDAAPIDLNAAPYPGEALYAWSKRWAEVAAGYYADRHGIATVSFRLSNPYGPFDVLDDTQAHVATAFVIRALAPGDVFKLFGATVERDFIFAGDVAEVFIRSMDWTGRSDGFNLASGDSTPLRVLAETVLAAAGSDKALDVQPETGSGPSARRMAAARVRSAFDMPQMTSLADGMRQTVDWYRHALGR